MSKKELPKEAPLEIQKSVACILSEKFGQTVAVDVGTPMRRSMSRFQILDNTNGIPASVVAKYKSGNRFACQEWAALQLLSESYDPSEPAPMPMFYGGDLELSLLVIEDLGTEDRLEETVMEGNFSSAYKGVVDFARCLGKMHGCSVGKRGRFEEIYNALGAEVPLTPLDKRDYWFKMPPEYQTSMYNTLHDHYVDMFLMLCAYIDVTPHPQTKQELESIRHYLTDANDPFLALTHEDIYGVNLQYCKGEMKVFDFEWCQYRSALSDGIKCRTAFDGWVYQWAIPDPIVDEMENEYRTELAKGCPQANDDTLFYRTLVEAAVMETIIGIYRRVSLERLFDLERIACDGIPERNSNAEIAQDHCRRLIQRCRLLAKLTDSVGYLEAIGETARRIEAKCRTFWPDRMFEIPLYPAFQQQAKE